MIRDNNGKPAPAGVCPVCGGPLADWGCRPVRLGDYCHVFGLREDLSRRPPASADPVEAAVEQDREVRRAAEDLAAAMDAESAAVSRWEQAALEGWRARARAVAESKDVFVGGVMQKIRPAGLDDRELARLAAAEAEADEVRRRASGRVIAARQRLDDARSRARSGVGSSPSRPT